MQAHHLKDYNAILGFTDKADYLAVFSINQKALFQKWSGAFAFQPAWIYGAKLSCRDLTGAKAVHKAGDSEPDTSLCDSAKSTSKAYLSEAETKASGLIFGKVNAVIADRENTMAL